MTVSGDVATVIRPIGMIGRDNTCAGNVYCANCACKNKKKKKKNDLAGQIFTVESESAVEIVSEENKLQSFEKSGKKVSKDLGNGKWKFKGKVGVWRTVRGRRRFYPDDGSESYPRHGKSGLLSRVFSGIKNKFKKSK